MSPPERPVAHKVLLVDDDDAVRAEVGTPNSPNAVRCKGVANFGVLSTSNTYFPPFFALSQNVRSL